MSLATERRSTGSLAVTLPERVFTRTGTSIDPREDVWVWTDGPFQARIDFRRYNNGFRWAAAGSVDTDLSFLSFLELYGTEIAERRMPARRVVEALDVVEHI